MITKLAEVEMLMQFEDAIDDSGCEINDPDEHAPVLMSSCNRMDPLPIDPLPLFSQAGRDLYGTLKVIAQRGTKYLLSRAISLPHSLLFSHRCTSGSLHKIHVNDWALSFLCFLLFFLIYQSYELRCSACVLKHEKSRRTSSKCPFHPCCSAQNNGSDCDKGYKFNSLSRK